MHEIMVAATERGHRLMRNNIGMAVYKKGGETYTVKYGVGGKGGSDLIGWTLRAVYGYQELKTGKIITLTMLPIFTVIETKFARGAKRKEQERFIDGVLRAGGIAGFCFSVEDYLKLIGEK